MVEAKNNTDDVPDTQETQAATQEASQVEEIDYDSELWGCLQPCKSESGLERIDFRREQTEYKLGRGLEVNDIQFPGMKISAFSVLFLSMRYLMNMGPRHATLQDHMGRHRR